MLYNYEHFDLEFATDESLTFLLDIHDQPEDLPLSPITQQIKQNIIGSKKRKRSTFEGYRPEKYDAKQFRTDSIQGNENSEDIAAKKSKGLLKQIDDNFYKEQNHFCNNYLKNFVKNSKIEQTVEMQRYSRNAALRLYEAVEIEDLPLDVPHVVVEQIIQHTQKLENEYENVSELAEKCIHDAIDNIFADNGAGGFNALTMIVGDPMINKKEPKPYISPTFNILPESSAYRILSYYKIGERYSDVIGMQMKIAQNFDVEGYHPTEEFFQAVGTARIGMNDLEFPGRRNTVDEIYLPYLEDFWIQSQKEDVVSSSNYSPSHKSKN